MKLSNINFFSVNFVKGFTAIHCNHLLLDIPHADLANSEYESLYFRDGKGFLTPIDHTAHPRLVIDSLQDYQDLVDVFFKHRDLAVQEIINNAAQQGINFVNNMFVPQQELIDNNIILLLKAELCKTDYQAIKFAEGVLSATDFQNAKSLRAAQRKLINDLEEKKAQQSELAQFTQLTAEAKRSADMLSTDYQAKYNDMMFIVSEQD